MEKLLKGIRIREGIFLIIALLFAFNFHYFWSMLGHFFEVISTLLIGGAIAYLLSRPTEKLHRRLESSKIKWVAIHGRGMAVTIIFISMIAIISLVISYAIPIIISNVTDFYVQFEGYFTQLTQWLTSLAQTEHYFIVDAVNELLNTLPIQDMVMQTGGAVLTVLTGTLSLTGIIVDIFLSLIFALYFLLYKQKFLGLMAYIGAILFTSKNLFIIKGYIRKSNEIFYSFISAQFLDACILGTLATILLGVLNVRYAITLGIILGIANMIPKFGSIVATVLVVLITILTGGFSQGLLVAVLLLILQQIDGNIIGPWIVGDALGLNPAFVMLAIVIGGAYHGVVGMFMAVPIAAVLKIIFFDLLDFYGRKKGLSPSDLKSLLFESKKK